MQNQKVQGAMYALIFIVIFGGLGALIYFSSDSPIRANNETASTPANINNQQTSMNDQANMGSSQAPAFSATPSSKAVTTKDGLIIDDIVVGTGDEAKPKDYIAVQYAGYLTDGTKFDSSYQRKEPFVFQLGVGSVIRGWDEGVAGMKVGGKRKLIIPAELGYGSQGAGGIIPPHATLVFDVELVGVKK